LGRVRQLREAFDDAWLPAEREIIAKHRYEVRSVLEGAECLCIAGGHVDELLHVLRLFDVAAALTDRIVAWSAGAMTLTERVVLFHDYAAQGPAPSEVLDAGLGVVTGIVALPHARRRLRIDAPLRMTVLERRFEPATCLRLDDGVRMDVAE
jgi:peptidase E